MHEVFRLVFSENIIFWIKQCCYCELKLLIEIIVNLIKNKNVKKIKLVKIRNVALTINWNVEALKLINRNNINWREIEILKIMNMNKYYNSNIIYDVKITITFSFFFLLKA